MQLEIQISAKKCMFSMFAGLNSSMALNLLRQAIAIIWLDYITLKSLFFRRAWHVSSKPFIFALRNSEQISILHVLIAF
jgi:hypothetical protein